MSDRPPEPQPWWDDYVWRPPDDDREPLSPDEQTAPSEPTASQERQPAPITLVKCWRCDKLIDQNTNFCPYCRAEVVPRQCWRCDKLVEQNTNYCPHCRAEIVPQRRRDADDAEDEPVRGSTDKGSGLAVLLAFFGGLLLVSLIQGVIIFSLAWKNQLTSEDAQIIATFAAGIDTILVLIALVLLRRPSPIEVSSREQVLAWILAGPGLIFLLGINLAYHQALRSFLGLEQNPLEKLELTPWLLLLFCVQPAVVEELFFRYLALGTLQRYMGLHAAVFVSSVMFGMAHVGQPFGIPVLTLIGVGLAYLRLFSGGLVLPVLMHFLHNLVVLLVNNAS